MASGSKSLASVPGIDNMLSRSPFPLTQAYDAAGSSPAGDPKKVEYFAVGRSQMSSSGRI